MNKDYANLVNTWECTVVRHSLCMHRQSFTPNVMYDNAYSSVLLVRVLRLVNSRFLKGSGCQSTLVVDILLGVVDSV